MTFLFKGLVTVLPAFAFSATTHEQPLVVVSHVVTSMSVVGPEVHFLIKNLTDREIAYHIQPSEDSKRTGCRQARQTFNFSRGPTAWSAVREALSTQAGLLAPHGIGHRVYAVAPSKSGDWPCRLNVSVLVEDRRIPLSISVAPRELAQPLRSNNKPATTTSQILEYDAIENRLLSRIVLWNDETVDFNVAVVDRRIKCQRPGVAVWDMLMDVPQGLAAGPARVDAGQWAVFVNVIRTVGEKAWSDCTVEFDLGYETIPNVYLPLTSISFPLRPHGRFAWSGADQ